MNLNPSELKEKVTSKEERRKCGEGGSPQSEEAVLSSQAQEPRQEQALRLQEGPTETDGRDFIPTPLLEL